AYLDGELTDESSDFVERQIAQDHEASRRLAEFRATSRALRSAPQPDFEAARERVWERIEAAKQDIPAPNMLHRRVSIPMPLAAAAAFVLLISGFLVSYFALSSGVFGRPDVAGSPERVITVGLDGNEETSDLLQALNSRETVRQVKIDMPENRRFHYGGEARLIKATEAGALLQGEAW
ncbi:MAG: anti-sigma factor family protein, partial [Spirochaetales bacterium]